MRFTMRFLFAAMLAIWVIPVAAQHMGHHGAAMEMPQQMSESGGMQCMMHGAMMQNVQGVMMGQMMNDPMMHARVLIAALPTMDEPLSLSDEQSDELSKIKADYESRSSELMDQIGQARGRLEDALASTSPDPSQVKEILHDVAAREADFQAAGFEAAMSMKSRLSPDQRAKMDAMNLNQYMMANMTMMDMMHAMYGGTQSGMMKNMMHGSNGTMGGMKGSMKHGGMMN